MDILTSLDMQNSIPQAEFAQCLCKHALMLGIFSLNSFYLVICLIAMFLVTSPIVINVPT